MEPQSKKPKLSYGLREGKSTSSGKGDINDIAAQISANTLCFHCGEYGHASKMKQGDKFIRCRNTDAGIRALATGCPQLQSLNISNSGNITDVGIRALATGCPQLQSLNISK